MWKVFLFGLIYIITNKKTYGIVLVDYYKEGVINGVKQIKRASS